jgi:predicted choloylglycine hydrolase
LNRETNYKNKSKTIKALKLDKSDLVNYAYTDKNNEVRTQIYQVKNSEFLKFIKKNKFRKFQPTFEFRNCRKCHNSFKPQDFQDDFCQECRHKAMGEIVNEVNNFLGESLK